MDFKVSENIKNGVHCKAILKHHVNVHEIAREIVELQKSNNIETAREKLLDFESERYQLFEALDGFYILITK